MKMASVASMVSDQESLSPESCGEGVVEIGILLPANRAADLIRIAKSRQESVGHMLRKMIDRELASTRCLG